jgi:hypothetical protein
VRADLGGARPEVQSLVHWLESRSNTEYELRMHQVPRR